MTFITKLVIYGKFHKLLGALRAPPTTMMTPCLCGAGRGGTMQQLPQLMPGHSAILRHTAVTRSDMRAEIWAVSAGLTTAVNKWKRCPRIHRGRLFVWKEIESTASAVPLHFILAVVGMPLQTRWPRSSVLMVRMSLSSGASWRSLSRSRPAHPATESKASYLEPNPAIPPRLRQTASQR